MATPYPPVQDRSSDRPATEQSPARPQNYSPPPVIPLYQQAPLDVITGNDKVMAALSYFLIPWVGLIALILDDTKNRTFTRYHAIQSLGFAVGEIIFEMAATVAYIVLGFLTLGIGFAVFWFIFFIPLALNLYYIYLAAVGRYFKVPFVTDFMVREGMLPPPPVG